MGSRFKVVVFFFVLISQLSQVTAQTAKIDSLKRDAFRLKGDTGLVWTYIRLGINFQAISYDSALYYMRQSNKAARAVGFKKGIASSHIRIGNTFLTLTEFDSALWHYNIALKQYQDENDLISQARIYNNLGLVSQKKGDYTRSIEYYLQSRKIKEDLKDEVAIASTSSNIGIVFALQKDYWKADLYMREAMDIFNKIGDSAGFYGVAGDYSQLLFEMNDLVKSHYWVNRALRYYKATDFTPGIARCELNKGKIAAERGEYQPAIYHFNTAKKLFESVGDIRWLSTCNIELSKAHFNLKHYDKSLELANEALEDATPSGSREVLSVIYRHLSLVHATMNNYRQAYEYHVIHKAYSDSLGDDEKHRTILELEGKFNDEKQRREIEELKSEKAEEELIKKKRETQTYILFGVLVLTLVSVGLFWYQYRIKQRSNIVLQEKNEIIANSLQEKEVLLREIHHRVQNNLQFVSSLISLQSRHIEDQKTVQLLKECRTRIQSMAMIHQKLYQEKSLKGINIDSYVNNLIETISGSYNVNKDQIEVITEIDPVELDINTAIPIGLILNELITNAFKYAFESREKGRLLIRLRHKEGRLHLTVQDDGVGLPESYDINDSSSFGMKLVHSLAGKLKAKMEVTGGIGTTIHLEINEFELTS